MGRLAGWLEGQGAALSFDENYRPKPAYYALRDALAPRQRPWARAERARKRGTRYGGRGLPRRAVSVPRSGVVKAGLDATVANISGT